MGCIEADPVARETLSANGLWPILVPFEIRESARVCTPASLGLRARELTLLAGAPPCQPFSKAAQWAQTGRSGLQDARIECLSAFFDLVERFLPSAILLENVSGFVFGRTSALPTVESFLARINAQQGTLYRLQWSILDAADFGVPQRRKRAILMAFRDGRAFELPAPTHKHAPVRAFDAIGTMRISNEPRACGKWADLLATVPEGSNYLFHTPSGGGRPLFGRRTRYWSFLLKLAKDQPSWTISAQPGPATGPFHWNGRPLTTKELLRLQSFPGSWKVSGSRLEQVRQIGNATPPLLAEVLGRFINQQLLGTQYSGKPELHIPRKRRIPSPTAVNAVPQRFSQLEGAHLPHAGAGKGPRPIKA